MSTWRERLKITARQKWGLGLALTFVVALLLLRVSTYKYSFDSTVILTVFRNLFLHQSALVPMMGRGYVEFFNIHFSPMYVLLSPLYLLGPTALIFLWKVISYGGFLLVIWRLIDSDDRTHLPIWQKNIFLCIVAAHPTFVSNLIAPNIWDSDLIFACTALSTFYLSKDRHVTAILWLAITFLIKENMMLVGFFYGFLISILTKRKIYLAFSAISLVWFVVVTTVLMPSYSEGANKLELLNFSFGHLGGSMLEVITNAVLHPQLLIENGWWMRKFGSLLIIFSCLGFLPFFGWRSSLYLLPSVAVLGYAFIAAQPYLDYSKHYVLVLYAFAVWASYESYRLVSLSLRKYVAISSIFLSLCVVMVLQINVRGWSYYLQREVNFSTMSHIKEAQIPRGAKVFTSGVGSPWSCYGVECFVSGSFDSETLAQEPNAFIFINLRSVFWEVMECDDTTLLDNLVALNRDENYEVLSYIDDIILLRRKQTLSVGLQPDWSSDLTLHQKTNSDCMKSAVVRRLRLL